MNAKTKEVVEMLGEVEKIDQAAIKTIKELVKTLHEMKKKKRKMISK